MVGWGSRPWCYTRRSKAWGSQHLKQANAIVSQRFPQIIRRNDKKRFFAGFERNYAVEAVLLSLQWLTLPRCSARPLPGS